MKLIDPEFPPLLTGIAVAEGENPAQIAFDKAANGELGAGDLIWSQRTDSATIAVILEPEVAAEDALSMVPLALVAVGDCLGAIGPPNMPITFDWPRTILANAAVIGSVDMRFPDVCLRDQVPDFAVLSLSMDIMWGTERSIGSNSMAIEPGRNLMRTVLHEEGAGDLDRTQIIESWARHFTAWIDTWEQDGFKPVHENWLYKAHYRNEMTSFDTPRGMQSGVLIGMDEKGGLLLKQGAEMKLFSLGDLWFDPMDKEGLQ